ncbi:MAG: hypothetical protein KC609_01590 [Myxococcales bacterium]|nr:hypothetical protein [Myxococcales bacterium]
MKRKALLCALPLLLLVALTSTASAFIPKQRCIASLDIGFNAMMNASKSIAFVNEFRYAPHLHLQIVRFACQIWRGLEIGGGIGINVMDRLNVGAIGNTITMAKFDVGAEYYFGVFQSGPHQLFVVPGLRLGTYVAGASGSFKTQAGMLITILARLSYILNDHYEFRFTPLMFELLPAFTKAWRDQWKGGGVYNYSFLFGFGYRFSI